MKDKSPREQIGEYEHPDNEWLSEVARDIFLSHVKKLKPEVLTDLCGEPLQLYQASWLQFPKYSYIQWPDSSTHQETKDVQEVWAEHYRELPLWGVIEANAISDNGAIGRLRESLFSWSEKHNLNAAWCRERAYLTLEQWSAYPDMAGEEWCPFPVLREGLSDSGMPPGFDWSITTEKSVRYLDWITEQAHIKLKTDPLLSIVESSHQESFVRQVREEAKKRCDALRERAESSGFRKVNWPEIGKHALWAAKRQVLGKTLNKIVKEERRGKPSEVAVSKAVRAFLSRVGLPERTFARAGRPRSK